MQPLVHTGLSVGKNDHCSTSGPGHLRGEEKVVTQWAECPRKNIASLRKRAIAFSAAGTSIYSTSSPETRTAPDETNNLFPVSEKCPQGLSAGHFAHCGSQVSAEDSRFLITPINTVQMSPMIRVHKTGNFCALDLTNWRIRN